MVQGMEAAAGVRETRLASIARFPTRVRRDGVLEDGNKSRVWIDASGPPRLSPRAARCLLNILLKASHIDHQVDPEAPEARAVSS